MEADTCHRLATVDSDWQKYKEWRDKPINAIRSARPNAYTAFKEVIEKLERGDHMALNDIELHNGWDAEATQAMSTELYCVLVAETTSRPHRHRRSRRTASPGLISRRDFKLGKISSRLL